MKRSRFSEEQIIGILKEHQAGLGAKELCRKHGISDATFYKWRSKYGGMEVSDARRLKMLEAENAKLKKMLAEQILDVATLKEMLGKTSEARFEATRRGLGHERKELLATTCLCAGWDRSACVSAAAGQAGGQGIAPEAAGTVRRASAVRLSAPAHSAEAGGLGCELEEALPDLPPKRVNSTETGRTQACYRHQSTYGDPAGAETSGGAWTSCRTRFPRGAGSAS